MANPLDDLIPQSLVLPKADTWAIVRNVRPLAIQVWGDTYPLQGAPETLVPLASLNINDRVIITFINNRATILGRVSQVPPNNRILWMGAQFMMASQTALLSERVSDQTNGIMLRWQKYSSGSLDLSDIQYTVIPKHHVNEHPGRGTNCTVWPSATGAAYSKYIYVEDTQLRGYSGNEVSPRNTHVLSAVIGF